MCDPLFVQNEFLYRNITISEAAKVVKKARLGKSAGNDFIPYEVLRNEQCLHYLHALFQYCFDIGKTTSVWHDAIIVPIPKSKTNDPRVPLNYRGISLLCTCAKLYSSVLNNRIVQFLETNNILAEEQNGFRASRSCLDHIFSLTCLIRQEYMIKARSRSSETILFLCKNIISL